MLRDNSINSQIYDPPLENVSYLEWLYGGRAVLQGGKLVLNWGLHEVASLGSTTAKNWLLSGNISASNGYVISTSASELRAIAVGSAELNANQAAILARLDGYGSRVIIPKAGFNYNDLAALTAKTGDEFALFRSGNQLMIMRGNPMSVPISLVDGSAHTLAGQGWRWAAHVHPDGVLRSSLGDRNVLSVFRNERSIILEPFGGRGMFNQYGDLISPNWLPH